MKQITVLTRKHPDELARVTALLGEAGVNIEEIDAERLEETGVIVLSVDRYDEALRVLADHGLRAITQNALVIRIEDKPGALAAVARQLLDANVDTRSMHILRRADGASLVSLVVSDHQKASELLASVVVAK